MKRITLAVLLAIAAAGISTNAFAFSIAVDLPTQYTLDDRTVDKLKSAKATDQTNKDVKGFKVQLAGAQHIGVGYEHYEISGKGVAGSPFDFTTTFQFYDLVLDLPTRWVNFGLGYGAGTVNSSIKRPGGGEPGAKAADASQWFASLGIPLGEHFDVHAAYHGVTAKDQKLSNTGSPDALTLSGHAIMAGIRLAW
jgi:hypothetical protein